MGNGMTVATFNTMRRETPFVKFNCNFSLFPFGLQIGKKSFKNFNSLGPSNLSNKKVPVLFGIL